MSSLTLFKNIIMNTNPEVDEYLKSKEHPLNDEINRVRMIILETDDRIEETIKWSSPTFMYKGNIASFFMNAQQFVSLMFHQGAAIEVDNNLLEGDGKEARVARFNNMEDIEAKKSDLEAIIKAWIQLQDS